MINISKILYIVNNNKIIAFLTVLFISSSIIDLIGLGLLIPYVNLILNPEKVNSEYFLSEYLIFLGDNLIFNLSLLIILVFFLKFISAIFINYLIYRNSQWLIHSLRLELLNSFYQTSYYSYLKKNSSYYIECLTTWTQKFGNNILVSFLRILNEGFNFLVIVIFLSFNNIKLLIVILCFLLVIIFLYTYFFKNILQRYGKIVNVTNEKITQLINEAFVGFKDIRIYKKENLFFNWIKKNSLYSIKNTIKTLLITNSNRYFFEFLAVIFFVSLVLLSIFKNSPIQLEISGILIFGYGLLRLMPISNLLLGSYLKIRQDGYVIDKVYKELAGSREKQVKKKYQSKNSIKIKEFKDISFENITYKYNKTNKPTLNNLNLKIKKGERVAIVGQSGAGKTTLLNIILGLLEPNTGKIKINGTEINNMLEVMNKITGYVPQEVFILDESIEKNITLNEKISHNDRRKIVKILKQVNLYEIFKNNQRSLKNKIGQSGIRISGGQRQRLALARALYQRKEIIIFDEATSSLDLETERDIYKELSKFKRDDYTFLVITHKKENLKFFDKIINLKRGKIEKIKKNS